MGPGRIATTHALEDLGPVLEVEVRKDVLLAFARPARRPLLRDEGVFGVEQSADDGVSPAYYASLSLRAHLQGMHLICSPSAVRTTVTEKSRGAAVNSS